MQSYFFVISQQEFRSFILLQVDIIYYLNVVFIIIEEKVYLWNIIILPCKYNILAKKSLSDKHTLTTRKKLLQW